MDNLTLATCSYNTPLVTLTMLRSFFAHHNPTKVIVCDNSTNSETADLLAKHNVSFFKNKGGLHSSSVDLLLGKCQTKYMLLVDTDIIFLQNHKAILDQCTSLNVTLLGEICGDRGGKSLYNRVHPWHCFIDVETVNKHNIKFHDSDRLSKTINGKIYDVGASFFEDIKNAKLNIGNVFLQDKCFKHYEGMSWRTLKYGNVDGNIDIDLTATHNNVALYNYGLLVEKAYSIEIENYKNVEIKAL